MKFLNSFIYNNCNMSGHSVERALLFKANKLHKRFNWDQISFIVEYRNVAEHSRSQYPRDISKPWR